MNTIWHSEEVKIRIGQLHRLGRDLSYTGVWHEHPELLFAAIHYFGNWGRAVAARGIDYAKVRRVQAWTRTRIVRELRKASKNGKDLSYNVFKRYKPKLFHAAAYHFGGWKQALAAIGVDYATVRKLRSWSREEVLRTIKQLNHKRVDLSHRAMFARGYGVVVSMGAYYFGGWRQTIRQAGLDYSTVKKKPGPLPGRKRAPSKARGKEVLSA